MIKRYQKQVWRLLKENKLLSIISIIGTALAISIIMVVIILIRAKMADYEPEVNKHRMLYVKWASAVNKENEGERNYYRLSLRDMQQVFYPLETPEAVSAVYPYGSALTSVPGTNEEINSDVLYADVAFWKIYRFHFLAGKPYDQASFDAGFKQAVLCETTARNLFGGANEALGKEIEINFANFTVVGVVKDVSKFAEQSYAEVWLPYTSNSTIFWVSTDGWGEGRTGGYKCFILARSSKDFPAIIEEVRTAVARDNAGAERFALDIMEQPNTFFEQMLRSSANNPPPVRHTVIRYSIIISIVLLVPAINLSGLTQSRMRKRMAELGVRKAFGAKKSSLLWQVINENMALTLIGGLAGLLFSYLSLWLLSGWLMASDMGGVAGINASMISPWIFAVALAFCLVLNLLSAGIPAWRASRIPIVNALNER